VNQLLCFIGALVFQHSLQENAVYGDIIFQYFRQESAVFYEISFSAP